MNSITDAGVILLFFVFQGVDGSPGPKGDNGEIGKTVRSHFRNILIVPLLKLLEV